MAYSNGTIVVPPSGAGHMELHVEWYESGTNVVNNTSNIHLEGYIYNPDGATLFDTYGNGHGTIRLYWHDNLQGEIYLDADTNVTRLNGYETITVSKNFTVTHNNDGSLLGYAGIEWVKNSNLNWMPESVYVNTGGYAALTTIPRMSLVSEYSIYPNNNTYAMKFVRQNDAFRERLRISIVNVKALKIVQPYISGTTVSLTNAELEDLYEATKNFNKGKCEIGVVLETWTADFKTKIGESYEYKREFTVTDPPTFDSIIVTDEGVAKTFIPNVYECMSLLSKKHVKVSASAKKHATIKSIVIAVGTSNKKVDAATANELFDNLTNSTGEITYTITATDSRDNEVTWTKKAKYHQYIRPSIIDLNVARNGAESFDGAISADGEYWQGKVGNTNNAINVIITGSATGSTMAILNGNKWNAVKAIAGADPNKSYTYTLTATDSFGQSISRDVTLSAEKPIMQLGKTQVNVNGNFMAENYYFKMGEGSYKNLIDFFYPVGSILCNADKNYDPNKVLGGIWEKIEDRFVLGASNNTPIQSTGGQGASGIQTSGEEVSGYGLVNGPTGFANRVMINSGNGDYHSNWPPYFAANIWRRIA